MNQSSVVVEKPSQETYTNPPPIGYPTRDVAAGDPVVATEETKSRGGAFEIVYIFLSVYFL
ncbi:unnamed protein product [Brassica napus]|uniref:(rape) hypothetical protein n=1 Tax=Brassica napus TaxID=3708 RepID=A0A816VYJ4_BRANA|nr:unnamed protein product [Brassica napus]